METPRHMPADPARPADDPEPAGASAGPRRARLSVTGLVACLGSLLVTSPPLDAADLVRQERNVSGFDGVTVEGSGELIVAQDDTEGLVIEAEERVLALITTEVSDGVLTISRVPGARIPPSSPIRFLLTVRTLATLTMTGSASASIPDLDGGGLAVSISGSSTVKIGSLEVSELDADVLGSGSLKVEALTASTVRSRIGGSGVVNLTGRAMSQNVEVTGSGDHEAGRLETERAEVTVLGSGNADVWVSSVLDAHLMGSGDIRYRGAPSVNSTVSGSGELRRVEG